MAHEDDERDQEFEEFTRRKERSGKVPSERNPKGAGRPSREWREFQEFLEYKKLKAEGITSRGLSEIIGGFISPGEGLGDGVPGRKSKGYLGRIAKEIFPQASKKMIKSVEKYTLPIEGAVKYTIPYMMPYLAMPVAILAGIGLWYAGEHYLIWTARGLTGEEKKEMEMKYGTRIINIELVDNKYNVTYRLLNQVLHTLVEAFRWTWEILRKYMDSEHELTVSEFVFTPRGQIGFLKFIFGNLLKRDE